VLLEKVFIQFNHLLAMSFWKNLPSHLAQILKLGLMPALGKVQQRRDDISMGRIAN